MARLLGLWLELLYVGPVARGPMARTTICWALYKALYGLALGLRGLRPKRLEMLPAAAVRMVVSVEMRRKGLTRLI